MTPPEGYLSTAEVMTRLGVSRRTIERWRNAGTLTAYVSGDYRSYHGVLYLETEVAELILARREIHPKG